MSGTTAHYLTGIILLAAMTPARGDCVSYYKPVQEHTVYSVVPTTPVDHATIQALCSTKYPGFSLLASTEITPEMALQCSGEVPLGLKRNGESVTWDMPQGIPTKPLTPVELANGTLEGNGTLGAINMGTGQWRLVDSDHTFTCAICQRSPKLDVHIPDGISPDINNYTINVTCKFVYEEKLFHDVEGDMRSTFVNNTICHREASDDSTQMPILCTFSTEKNIDTGYWNTVSFGNAGCEIYVIHDAPSCPALTTTEIGGVRISWADTTAGTVRIARNVANYNLMTRECLYNDISFGNACWSKVKYWEEVWQPCKHYRDPNSLLGCERCDIFPVPVKQLEEFLGPIDEYLKIKNQLSVRDDRTTTHIIVIVQEFMSPALLDSGNPTAIQELSSLVYAIVDLQDSFNGVLETDSWILDFSGTTSVKSVGKGSTKTRISLGLPQELIGTAIRVSIVATRVYSCGLDNLDDNRYGNQILLYLYFSNTVSNQDIGHISSLTIGVSTSGISDNSDCVFFMIVGDRKKVACTKIEDTPSMIVFESKEYSSDGFYLLRRVLPATTEVPIQTPPDRSDDFLGFIEDTSTAVSQDNEYNDETTPVPMPTPPETSETGTDFTNTMPASEVTPDVFPSFTQGRSKAPSHTKSVSTDTKPSDNSKTSSEDSQESSHQGNKGTLTYMIMGVIVFILLCIAIYIRVDTVMRGKCWAKATKKFRRSLKISHRHRREEGFVAHEVLEHDDPEGSNVTIHTRGRRVKEQAYPRAADMFPY